MRLKEKLVAVLSHIWVRYAIVGGISFAIAYGVFYLFQERIGYVYATMLAGTVAWLFNFPLHKMWTFGDWSKSKTPLQSGLHFSLKMWNTYGGAPLLMIVFVEFAGVHPLVAKPLVDCLLGTLQNYPINRYLIFRKPAA